MSFKGDLSTIGLAEVFQMISMSQKEGTLVVQDAESRKAIYFGATGVKLVSTGKRKGLRLGDILVRAGRVTESDLNDALENAKIQRKLLGEVLVENGAVTDQEIQQIVREQIEEEIYDLFLWKRANFEFIEGPASEGLKDLDAPVTKLSFDVNGLLLEAVRRADEWAVINQKLPSVDSIFSWSSPQAHSEEDQFSTDSAKRVYRFVDGQTAVSEIVENTGIPKFETCKILMDLADRSRIRLLDVPEMLDVAQRRMSDGQRERGVRLYLAAALQAPQDAKVAGTVARILEGEGQTREAAHQHAKTARLFIEQGDLDRAFDHMRKANELAPEDPDIRMGMFEVHAASGNLEEGKRLALELANEAAMTGDFPRARGLCDRILRVDPEAIDFRIIRAKVFHRTNQKRDLEEDLTFIRRKMPSDQKKAEEINNALRELMSRSPTTKASPSTVRAKAVAPKKKGGWGKIAAAVLVLGALGLGGKYEWDARREFLQAKARASEYLEKGSFSSARQEIEKFQKGLFRFSPIQKPRGEAFLHDLDERAVNWEKEKTERETRDRELTLARMKSLEAAVSDERSLNPESALEKAQELRRVAEGARDADYLKRADELIAALERNLSEALQLKVHADQLEKEGKTREAAMEIEKLLRYYPNTRSARGALYPLEITSIPAGVKVTNVRTGMVIGETGAQPLKHRIKDGESVRLLFEKAGYGSVEVPVNVKTVGHLHVPLTDKKEKWVMPLGFEASGEPALGELSGGQDAALFVASGNSLYALRLATQRLLWTENLTGAIQGSPRAARGRVFAATVGKSFYALDPRQPEKRVAWKAGLGERATSGPGVAGDGTAVMVVAADRQLYSFGAATGEVLWKRALPAEAVAEPLAVGALLVVACEDGSVVGLKAGTPDEAWTLRGDSGYLSSGVSGPYVYLTGSDQTVHAIDSRAGTRVWKRLLPVALSGRPVRVGNTLYVSGKDGRVFFLDAGTGESTGLYNAGSPILGGLTVSDTLLLFGSEDQVFTAFDTTRATPLWKFRANERLRCPAVVSEGVAYFCGQASLFAIDLN
jgi:outer membrane protein assembly factor BamB